MPGLTFKYLPEETLESGSFIFGFKTAAEMLTTRIARAVNIDPNVITLHFERTQLELAWSLSRGEHTNLHGIQVVVDWFEGRTEDQKALVGKAIDQFFGAIGLAHLENEVTFVDRPPGSYYAEREMIPYLRNPS